MRRILYPFLFLALAFLPACDDDDSGTETTTVPVSNLLSLTGNWSTLGLSSKAATEIAVEDINAYFASKGSKWRLSLNTQDTKLEAALAETAFNSAKTQGIRFIIGPQSSAELAALKPLADASNILVISQGSTAGTLALPGDPLLRFCPADKIEGAAIANTIYKQGIRGLVTLARDDDGNKGLQTSTGNAFTTLGGEVKALNPYGTTESDFSAPLLAVKSQILALKAVHGNSAVGVYLASFDECVALFKAAAGDPEFASVRWYGGDGVALSAALSGDADAAAFAVQTQFFVPSFGLPDAQKSSWEPLIAKIKARSGIDADAFGVATYDAMWVIAKTIEANNGVAASIGDLGNQFVAQANAYTGATGATTLDANGDRASGSFDYWGLEKVGDHYQWKLVGKSE